ncbi:hypothetical protein R6Q59_006378 [Mikania micrantha]
MEAAPISAPLTPAVSGCFSSGNSLRWLLFLLYAHLLLDLSRVDIDDDMIDVMKSFRAMSYGNKILLND